MQCSGKMLSQHAVFPSLHDVKIAVDSQGGLPLCRERGEKVSEAFSPTNTAVGKKVLGEGLAT